MLPPVAVRSLAPPSPSPPRRLPVRYESLAPRRRGRPFPTLRSPMRRRFRPAAAGLLLGALGLPALVAGCDQAPGLPEPPGIPPGLAAFSVTPDTVRFEGVQDGDSARVQIEIRFDAIGSVAAAAFAVTPQFADACVAGSAPRPPVIEGNAEVSGPGSVVFTPEFAVARDEIGLFDVTVAVFDADGRRSNRGVTIVPVVADPLGPPTLADASLPTVPLPASGLRAFTIAATVSDPDGARDIARVEVELLDLPGNVFPLLDDGESGDGEACDGRYALTLQVGADSGLEGVQPAEVRVTDRAGNTATQTGEITFLAP